jgi:hypothetical protein
VKNESASKSGKRWVKWINEEQKSKIGTTDAYVLIVIKLTIKNG